MTNSQINRSFTDQMGNEIRLEKIPRRIISIVPSQTELLYDLGLSEEVVGITKFCIHPEEWFSSKARVGGTKKLNLKKINELNPDLIIGNKEENEEGQIKELMKQYPVWMSDIKNLKEACSMIENIGEIVGKSQKSKELAEKIKEKFKNLKFKAESQKKTVMYFIWRHPYMIAGKNTFIGHILGLCGWIPSPEATPGDVSRYFEITVDQIKQIKPDLIFLSSEPYPFKEKHIAEFQAICPDAKILLVDGEMFSWYGSRLLKAPAYFCQLKATNLPAIAQHRGLQAGFTN